MFGKICTPWERTRAPSTLAPLSEPNINFPPIDDGHTETESMALVVQVDDPSLRIDGEERSHPHRDEAKPNLNVVVTIDLKELRRYTGDDGVVRCERYRSCKEYEAHFLLEDDDESQKRILNLDRVPLW